MNKIYLSLIACMIQTGLCTQEEVTIGKYRKIGSRIPGGEVTYLEHLPDGYEKSDKIHFVFK
jgi:hypothetical protein